MTAAELARLESEVSVAQHYVHTLERTIEQLERAASILQGSSAGFFDGLWAKMDEFTQTVKDRKVAMQEYERRLEDDLEAEKNGECI